ncbi:methyl-accepting chemotaxis protein [Uliginosibacterium aquaticum]|uniref:Cache domain-containing protein n=1 Tax=Uliginosibacterium aquaticum TaxID=2731212 RepID=A0ABX2II47_9RHOO|nr:methyl-accepting chemotaxis protein [Uliginosibacterium aquaticum]NSL56494.1 cache domain-containing protein [Uliginosibacterium aquaticum]
MKLSTRLIVMIAMGAVGLLLVGSFGLYSLRASMQAERHAQIENLLKMSIGLFEHLHAQETSGKLSRQEAQARAAEALAGLRNENNYLFARNAEDVFVAHVNPARLGKMDKGAKMADGRHVVEVYREALAKQGKIAFADIPTAKPGAKPEDLLNKLNGVTVFEPWGWTVGTGFFTDDIDATFLSYALRMLLVSTLILAASIGFAIYSSRRIYAQLGGDPAYAAEMVNHMAAGELNLSLGSPPPGSLIASLASMCESLKAMISQIQAQSSALARTAGEIDRTMSEISEAATDSAEATASTAASVEEMTVSVGMIADSAHETEGHSSHTAELASSGEGQIAGAASEFQKVAQQIDSATHQIGKLDEQSRQIGGIANEIQEIAEQTNLLALNAAIEAARAGEQGRGFAVVADEVRKLAERTARATQEINRTIIAIQAEISAVVSSMQAAGPQVTQSVSRAEEAACSLREISSSTRSTLDKIHDVAHATAEQNAASTNIATQVERIATMLEEAERSVRGASESVSSLSVMARDINVALERFRV